MGPVVQAGAPAAGIGAGDMHGRLPHPGQCLPHRTFAVSQWFGARNGRGVAGTQEGMVVARKDEPPGHQQGCRTPNAAADRIAPAGADRLLFRAMAIMFPSGTSKGARIPIRDARTNPSLG